MNRFTKAIAGLSALVIGACASNEKVKSSDEIKAFQNRPVIESANKNDDIRVKTYEEAKRVLTNEETQRVKDDYAEVREKVDDIAATLNTVFRSRYIATPGFVVVDNPVIQSDLTISSGRIPGITANIWGNYNPESDRFTEVDFTIAYTAPITDNLTGNISASYFDFDFGELDDLVHNIVDITAGIDTVGLPLDVSFRASQIFSKNRGHGQMYRASARKSFDITRPLGLEGVVDAVTLGGGISAAYNDHYATQGNGFSHASGEIGINIDVGNGWTLYGSYLRQIPLDTKAFPKDTFPDTDLWSVGFTKQF
ncbi:MAG: hypothetical protein AABY16_02295 [Nanoarchaeota archaeon]